MDTTTKSQLKDIVQELEKHVPYASALLKKRSGVRVSVNRVQESIEPEDPSHGLVFTLWNGQTFFEYATNQWDWKDLKSELKRFAKKAARSIDNKLPQGEVNPGPSTEKDYCYPENFPPVPNAQKLKIARDRV